MAAPSLGNLALADVTPADVKRMIGEGESLVELKSVIPPEGIGPTVASFANTLGGWVILGVQDSTREVVGWRPKGRADVLDYIRDLLRNEVDPLPPFAAKMVRVGRRNVGLIRVYESADTPHVVRGMGTVFIRDPGAKRPIGDRATLIELARRGEDAAHRARVRLAETPAVASLLRTPDSPYWAEDHPTEDEDEEEDERNTEDNGEDTEANDVPLPDIRLVVRAAPLTVTPTVSDWPLTRAAGEWVLERTDAMIGHFMVGYGRSGPLYEPFGRAIAARVSQEKGFNARDEGLIVVDSAGVVGAQLVRGAMCGDRPTILLNAMLDDELLPLAKILVDALEQAEAIGRAVAELWLLLPPQGQVAGSRRPAPREMRAVREITVPANEDEVRALAEPWHREIQRAVGIVKFEDDADDPQ